MRVNIKQGFILLSIVLYAELLSALCLAILGIDMPPYPWYFLLVIKQGFYREFLISSMLITPLFILIGLATKTGITRFVSLIALSVLCVLALSFYLGLLIFETWSEQTVTSLMRFLIQLWTDKDNATIFIISQGISGFILSLIAGVIAFEKWRPAARALGNARFGNGLDIYQEGFFKQEQESIIIGKKLGAPLYSNGFEHVLVFAPSGSGKTRSIGIPNLFNYPYSIVCNDVKLTMFKTTSGYRARVLGHACYCWAPANQATHRFNPLSFISEDKLIRMTDIQRIGHILIPDNNKEAAIWSQASRKLFKALVLFLLDNPDHPTTLGEINRLIKQQNFDHWLLDILENTEHYDPEFYRNGFSYVSVHEKTRSSILETFSGYFELFDDPTIDAATSASDFDIRELRAKKITIYVGFTDEDMHRLAPILTLFWQQVISAMIKEIPDKIKEPYPLLCLVDEFSSLGRIEQLRRSLKLLREYRVRCILMFQYIAQTYERYSHDEAKAFTNIKTKIAYGSEDTSDAEFISKMLGTRTKKIVTRSVSSQSGGGISDSKNVGYQAIPLLRPEEIMKLKPYVSLIIRSGTSPIKAGQFIWYKEACMKYLEQSPVSVPIQEAKSVPFKRMSMLMVVKSKENDQTEEILEWVN